MTNVKKLSIFVSSICAVMGGLFLSAEATHAAALSITNSGFENPVLSDGEFNIAKPNNQSIPGWKVTSFGAGGNAGVFNPSNTAYAGASNPGSAFELAHGKNVAYTNGFALEQTLADVFMPSFAYTLSVDVGRRLDALFPSGGAFIDLLAGSNVLVSVNLTTVPEGDFITQIFKYTSPSRSPLLGQNLKIRLGSNTPGPGQGQVNFDNVKLDATKVPEPSSVLGFLALGAVGAGSLLKHKQQQKAFNSSIS